MNSKKIPWRYFLRRTLEAIPLIFIIIVLTFFLIHLAPGSPVTYLAGRMEATPEYMEQLTIEYGLDKPVHVQLWVYIVKVLQLDMGYSLRFRQDVFSLVVSRIGPTLLLMGTSMFISTLFGVLLGIIAARRIYSFSDNVTTLITLAGYSMPVFWLGQILLLVFSLHFGWFPSQGMYSFRVPTEGLDRILDVLRHLALPAITYSAYHLALLFRLTRVKMQETLVSDYITTAKAKGLSERVVLFRHALPNAMLPIVTIIGMNFAFMMAGSVLTETVFAWPGLGRLMFEAITARDYPLLMGLFICISVMVIIVNVITDAVYALIDPRVTYH